MKYLILSTLLALFHASRGWPMLGWQTYRDYDLYTFRPGEETYQFSSYDRANHNDDGFNGTYSCIRMDGNRCVLAEYDGPGEIESLWFTYDPDSVVAIGDILIELDGDQVLSGQLQDLVNGEQGAPFVWPLVGNTNDTMGGNVIKVPMPFAKSMLITTENNPHFYHVTYRRFPENVLPHTFDPDDAAEDVVTQLRAFGSRDPKSIEGGALGKHGKHVSGTIKDASGTVSLGSGCGIISQLSIRVPSVPATSHVTDDGRAFANGGSSSFVLSLDPNNKQCRLTRRVDTTVGNQKVQISVNGVDSGTLDSGASVAETWADQVLDIPAAATKNKTEIKVMAQCLASDMDCNEFFYALHCQPNSESWSMPGYMPRDDWILMDMLNVGPNNPNDELSHEYSTPDETWQGLREFQYADDMHTGAGLPDIGISLSFDDKKSVSEVPIGAFFGAGLAKGLTRSLLSSVDSLLPNGAWVTYYPMPFADKASVTLTSGDGQPLNASIDAVVQSCPGDGTAPSSQPWGYFSTQYRRGPTTPGELWPILSAAGPGVAYGLTHTFRADIQPPSNTLEFLEGDEQVWLNRTSPGGLNDSTVTILGTGTEDFYESGWYFMDASTEDTPVPYAMPMTGVTTSAFGAEDLGCTGSCLSVYRLMVGDSQVIPDEGISFNIEHGPDGNNIQADYETCAFYYSAPH